MNKKIDNAYLNQYTDNAIKRGYEIYDEWLDKRYDSRKIVASAEGAAKLFKKRKRMVAFIDALGYLFALDMRIRETYNTIWRCLFLYFSWRRETRALGSLKRELNIPLNETDIRNAIAVMIEKLAEKLENGWDDEGDDETHGGKRNGKAEEEVASEEKETEEATEENSKEEELDDQEEKEKDSEEKEETPVEEGAQEEAKEKAVENKEAVDAQQEEAEMMVTDEKEELAQEKDENRKEENNVSDDESEVSTDKKEEAKAYNDAVDSPPLYEETVRERSAEKRSFIDEMILDNMVKGDKSIIGYQRIDEAERNKEAASHQDTVASQNEKNKSIVKDAYLYDKMIATDKGEAQQLGKAESTKLTEKAPEIKTEQPKEPIQKNEDTAAIQQEREEVRVPLQVDINERQENEMRVELSLGMTSDVIEVIKATQSEFMRAQLDIAEAEAMRAKLNIAEFSVDSPVEISEKLESGQISQPSVGLNRK